MEAQGITITQLHKKPMAALLELDFITCVIIHFIFSVPHNEIYTRMIFLLFIGAVSGLIFYVLRPKLSERDLNNLHYVGLDSIIKKLLNHD